MKGNNECGCCGVEWSKFEEGQVVLGWGCAGTGAGDEDLLRSGSGSCNSIDDRETNNLNSFFV